MSRELASYEGLVCRTAQLVAGYPHVQEDEEDIRQLLRIKVWQALEAHDPSKRGMQNQTREEYVFMCVKNRVKDMLKKKVRPEDFIEDFAPTTRGEGARSRRERFEGRYLRHDEEAEVEAAMERTAELPSTLTLLEIHVVRLLLQELNQTEIARQLGVSRQKVRVAHAAVKVKMADWRGMSDWGQADEPAPLETGQPLSFAA
jgi:RNA polymerase sigma factor (sigma-70 family)